MRAEWLFETKKLQEKPLFLRENDSIEVSKYFKEGNGLEERTRDNALFLAVCDQFNGPISERIMQWLKNFNSIVGHKDEAYKTVTFDIFADNVIANNITSFFNQLDLGFDKLTVSSEPFSAAMLPENIPNFNEAVKEFEVKTVVKTFTRHARYNAQNQLVQYVHFTIEDFESAGTNKLFNLSGPIFYMLKQGGVLIIDELDSKLHPLMTQAVVRLFNDPEQNPNNAQLIFAMHNTNLLSNELFRRDQVYFTAKDRYGATSLYSLVEYKEEDGTKPRKDRSFEKDYIQGRYGAIPFIGDLSFITPTNAETHTA